MVGIRGKPAVGGLAGVVVAADLKERVGRVEVLGMQVPANLARQLALIRRIQMEPLGPEPAVGEEIPEHEQATQRMRHLDAESPA
jgi:hypothetical protein